MLQAMNVSTFAKFVTVLLFIFHILIIFLSLFFFSDVIITLAFF
eukprot:UN09160